MTVGDIYGTSGYTSIGLDSNMTASFFGKFTGSDPLQSDAETSESDSEPSSTQSRRSTRQRKHSTLKDEDILHSLLLMITNNIGQLAFLTGRLHNVKLIIYSGSFLRHTFNDAPIDASKSTPEANIACIQLTKSILFWSQGEMRALFLKHEGFFGALVFSSKCGSVDLFCLFSLSRGRF